MGSGETSPTMVKTHRELLKLVGGPAALLDTPYGFQMNADDLSARAQHYFRDSVGHTIDVVGYRSATERGTVAYEQAMGRLREAAYVFAGPGSPSYALRQWDGSAVPALLREKLDSGGCVTFASAAALTLGAVTVPVYEVYKVGAEPRWLPGLDVLGQLDLRVALIPHYDNAEGGNHDTRYCYLGEERLQVMERELPGGAFVIGIDEHTGVVFDADAGSVRVVGRGVMTVRAGGRSERWESGAALTVDELRAHAASLARGAGPRGGGGAGNAGAGASSDAGAGARSDSPRPAGQEGAASADAPTAGDRPAPSLILDAVTDCTNRFDTALAARRASDAVQAVLDLEAELHAWADDPTQSDELDRARAALRSLIARLGEVAEAGTRDPREVLGPYVDVVLEARRAARDGKRFDEADALRDRLVDLGVEVHDTPAGTDWDLPAPP